MDVHLSSGVANNAFYLMTMGGTNATSKIAVRTGIGWTKAERLMFDTETKYLLSSADWLAMANANLSAARALGYTQAEQNIIQCAWIAVGVIKTPATCAR